MLLDFKELLNKYKISIKGVCHIGFHWGEEMPLYKEVGFEYIIGIEPCKDAFKILQDKWNNDAILFNCAVGDANGSMMMNVERNNQGQSNSLLFPKLHLQQHPSIKFTETEEVEIRTLDSLPFIRERVNIICCDVQGYEGKVFKGGIDTLKHIDAIFTEVNFEETYEGCMLFPDLKNLLNDFEVVSEYRVGIWGDACLIRKSLLNGTN